MDHSQSIPSVERDEAKTPTPQVAEVTVEAAELEPIEQLHADRMSWNLILFVFGKGRFQPRFRNNESTQQRRRLRLLLNR